MLPAELPLQLSPKAIFLQKIAVVRPELINILSNVVIAILCVKIKTVEKPDPLQSPFIFWLEQVFPGTLVMHGVSRMVTNHIQALLRDGSVVGHQHAIHVFVMPPSPAELVKATMAFIHSARSVVALVSHIRIDVVELGEDYSVIRDFAPDNESVPPQSPLFAVWGVAILTVFFSAPKEHDLADVMKQTNKLKPVGMSCSANAFCRLKQMELVGKV
jgi:hypothetical protein